MDRAFDDAVDDIAPRNGPAAWARAPIGKARDHARGGARVASVRSVRGRRFAVVLAALVAAFSGGACGKDPAGEAAKPAAAALAPVPAPAGLLADVLVGRPDATWAKARAIVGGPAAFLPQGFGGLVATLLGLPMTAAGEIDGQAPACAAVVHAPGEERPHVAAAIRVRSGGGLVALLTKGESARFEARADAADAALVRLEPKQGAGAAVSLAVIGDYLVVAPTPGELAAVGPYAARTLPPRPAPAEDVAAEMGAAALAQIVVPAASSAWERVRPRPANASAAAEAAAPFDETVRAAIATLGDADRARLTIDLDDAAAHARLVLSPKRGGGPASKAVAELATGPAKRLLELPSDTLLALLVHQSAPARAASAKAQAEVAARLLGERATAKEREAIERALTELAEARGDWLLAGIRFGPTGLAGYGCAAVADAERMDGAIAKLLALPRLPPVKAKLDEAKLRIELGKTRVDGVEGAVQRVRFARVGETARGKGAAKAAGDASGAAPAGASSLPSSLDLLFRAGSTEILAALGYDAKGALVALAGAREGAGLAGAPARVAAIGALGDDVALALLVEPLAIVASHAGKPGAAEPAPVVIAQGRSAPGAESPNGALWFRLDVATGAIRELVRRRGALFGP